MFIFLTLPKELTEAFGTNVETGARFGWKLVVSVDGSFGWGTVADIFFLSYSFE